MHRRCRKTFWPILLTLALTLSGQTVFSQTTPSPSPTDSTATLPEGVKVQDETDAAPQEVLHSLEKPEEAPAETENVSEARSLSHSNENMQLYKIPLLFAPEDNKIGLRSPQIKWEMVNGKAINFGGLTVDGTKIEFKLSQQSKKSGFFGGGGKSTTISFGWPTKMVKPGQLEVLDAVDKVLWSYDVRDHDVDLWQRQFRSNEKSPLLEHRESMIGFADVNLKSFPFLTSQTPFKYCLRNATAENENIRICSPLYSVVQNGNLLSIKVKKSSLAGGVRVEKVDVGERGIVTFPAGKAINVVIRFASGANIEFRARPPVITLLDMVGSRDGTQIILVGRGTKPMGKIKDLIVPSTSLWAETGVGREVVWQMIVSQEYPLVRALAAWHIPFTYLFKFKKLPNEEDRVFISSRTAEGTYINGTTIHGYAPSGSSVTSRESSVKTKNDNLFNWTFLARDTGQLNHSRLLISKGKEGDQQWVSHYELYRTYASEASLRLTGLISADQKIILLGEIAAGHWFENLLLMDNYYLSNQRWGLNAKYFRSLASVATSDGAISTFNSLTADARFNLTPGLWNRDQLVGLIFGVQHLEYTQTGKDQSGVSQTFVGDSELMGVGLYWARTMPKIFDDVFNFVWLLRHPKYVDVDFIYYPLSLTPNIDPGTTFNLNIHGKVFITKEFFAEAGMSVKGMGISDNTTGASPDSIFASGTGGLGYIF